MDNIPLWSPVRCLPADLGEAGRSVRQKTNLPRRNRPLRLRLSNRRTLSGPDTISHLQDNPWLRGRDGLPNKPLATLNSFFTANTPPCFCDLRARSPAHVERRTIPHCVAC